MDPGKVVEKKEISCIPQELYEFIVGENGEIRILCRICQYMSNKKSNFKRHFTNMHFVQSEDAMMECCGIRFSTKGEKCQHTKSVHKFGYKCIICTKVFDRPALLQRHLAKHTGKKPYKCSLCTYQTPNKANAKRHIEKKHSDVQEGTILFVTDDDCVKPLSDGSHGHPPSATVTTSTSSSASSPETVESDSSLGHSIERIIGGGEPTKHDGTMASLTSTSNLFRQCAHGCWHHVFDNLVASDFSSDIDDVDVDVDVEVDVDGDDNEEDTETFCGGLVGSCFSKREKEESNNNINNNNNGDIYVPKKLRVARAFCKYD